MTPDRSRERGQMLVIFSLCLIAIVAMTGLVIDGGLTMVQRREQQNVADAAAMAGAYSYANTSDATSAAAQAQANAAANGYANGVGNVVVTVNVSTAGGLATITTTVTKPHRNFFSGIVGFGSWDVSTTASAVAGLPNAAIGAMPLLFNEKAFPNGNGPAQEMAFDEPGSGGEDVPQTANTFNWTVYCTANGLGNEGCNGNSSTVEDLINNQASRDKEVNLNDAIGPLNAGAHTTLFSALASMVGEEFPVSIVNDDGEMEGWAMFHLTGSIGGSTKQIRGYFVAPVNYAGFRIVKGGGTGGAFGDTVVKLTN